MATSLSEIGYEQALAASGFGPVAGADEAGRGACAGPLVAAAVVLSEDPQDHIEDLHDSKTLTARRRERAFDQIKAHALSWSVVCVGPAECDRLGMQEADLQGLRRALLRLDPSPGFALTDGFAVAGLPVPGLGMWKGDRVCACVSAASIVAKVTRDRLMVRAAQQFPGYGFEIHKGYATKLHQERLEALGPSAIHRRSYANVRRAARLNES
ncbi:Ribonuclease HII [Propionibacterium freudenreichii]|nr:Ribonuclease HII [Propionibacterium freudenreichii]SCQ80789.1 Ribonuclease HII [Propionibacterium freudenreichii]